MQESYWNRGKKNKGFQFNNEMQDRRESYKYDARLFLFAERRET